MGDRVLWAFRHDMPGESDEQLTDRARGGDKSAFGELYRRHRKAAESTAWCMLRSKSDADDVVSDAFAGVLSALRNGRGPRDNFRGYLLACVRNGCRSRKAPTLLVDDNQLERWSRAQEDPERYIEADTVARAFSALTPRWQHTLWMTEVEQLPATEVSDRLSLSPNATAALTHRARQAFATAYLAEHVATATGRECQRIAAHLPGYVRNQLRDIQQAGVERHLVNCPRCAAAVDDLRDVNASLRSLMPAPYQAVAVAAVASQATVASTVGGGITLGIPATSVLLKGLVAVLLVAPALSTDSPFTSGRSGGPETRTASVREAATASDDGRAFAAAPTTDARPVEPVPATEQTAEPTAQPNDDKLGDGRLERPTATVPVITLPAPAPALPAPTTPTAVLNPVTDLVEGAVDDVVYGTLRPIVGSITEPAVQTVDGALAMMGLGSTGETVTMLRTLVPLLDGPLLGPVIDELLEITTLGDAIFGAAPPATAGSVAGDVVGDVLRDVVGDEVTPTPAPPIGPGSSGSLATSLPQSSPVQAVTDLLPAIPEVVAPVVSIPPIAVPPVVVPVISVPPISIPVLGLPAVNLPVISVAPVTLPHITLSDLLS